MPIQAADKEYETDTLEVTKDERPGTLYIVRNGAYANIGVTRNPLPRLMAKFKQQQPGIELLFECECANDAMGFGMLFAIHGEFVGQLGPTGWYPYAPIRSFLDNARQRGSSWAIGGVFHLAERAEESNGSITF